MRLPGFIEVELGTYCNRRGGWCPNAFSPRGQQRRAMQESTWEALLDDLHAHHFRGWFAFHNYNEPLADPHLLPRVERATERLLTWGDVLWSISRFCPGARPRCAAAQRQSRWRPDRRPARCVSGSRRSSPNSEALHTVWRGVPQGAAAAHTDISFFPS